MTKGKGDMNMRTNMLKKNLLVLLCVVLLMSSLSQTIVFANERDYMLVLSNIVETTTPPALRIEPVPSVDVYITGMLGTAPWTLYDDGLLVVMGGNISSHWASNAIPANSPWAAHANVINRIVFTEPIVAGNSLARMFFRLSNVTSIEGLEYLDSSTTTNMSYMFFETTNLVNLNVTNLNTSNVTTMHRMFDGTHNLINIVGIQNWQVGNVQNMNRMFENTRSLEILDLSGWDTSSVSVFTNMFAFSGVREMYLTDWSTSSDANMRQMFLGARRLTNLDVSGWDTSNVTNMYQMFISNENLINIKGISNWDTGNVTNMSRMFDNTHSLESLDLSAWDTSSVTTFLAMFSSARSLTCVGNLSNWDTSSATNMAYMFQGTRNLTNLNLTGWNTSNVTTMQQMFFTSTHLINIEGISNWDIGNVTQLNRMFQNANALESLDLSSWDTSNVIGFNFMFSNAHNLTTVGDLSNWDTSSATGMRYMFQGAHRLISLNLSNWDTINVTDKVNMFATTYSLREITFGENFVFTDNTNLTPLPNNTIYTGRWRNVGHSTSAPWSYSLTSTQLVASSNPTNANRVDTWVRETHIRQYHITYIYVDFMHPSTIKFLQGNLSLTELVHILGNTPSLLNRTYETGTFAQVLRELPIPALSGWKLMYSYIIFENPAMGITGHISQLPVGFDVDNVSGNITIIVLFI